MQVIGSRTFIGGSGATDSVADAGPLEQSTGEGYPNRGVVSPCFLFSDGTFTGSYAVGNNGNFDTYQKNGRIFNSHMPKAALYKQMLASFEPIRATLSAPRDLTAEELIKIGKR